MLLFFTAIINSIHEYLSPMTNKDFLFSLPFRVAKLNESVPADKRLSRAFALCSNSISLQLILPSRNDFFSVPSKAVFGQFLFSCHPVAFSSEEVFRKDQYIPIKFYGRKLFLREVLPFLSSGTRIGLLSSANLHSFCYLRTHFFSVERNDLTFFALPYPGLSCLQCHIEFASVVLLLPCLLRSDLSLAFSANKL